MRYICFLSALVFLQMGSLGYSADLKDGFLSLKWKTHAADLAGFSKIRDHGKVSYYINPDQVHVLNDVEVSDVIFGFYEHQFFSVYIRIDRIHVFGEIKNYLTTKYGNPSTTLEMRNELTTYRWKYKKTKVKLKYYEKSGYMKLAFYYTPLSGKVNEEALEQIQDKSLRLFPIDKDRKPQSLPSIPLLQF